MRPPPVTPEMLWAPVGPSELMNARSVSPEAWVEKAGEEMLPEALDWCVVTSWSTERFVGVTEFEAADWGPGPITFTAATLKV